MRLWNSSKTSLKMLLWGARWVLGFFVHYQEVSILVYHAISDAEVNTAISADTFARHLEILKRSGAEFVTLEDVVLWVQSKKQLPKRSVALTFDDGYADFETTALPILKKCQAPATVFIVGDEQMSRPRLVNAIALLTSESLERLRENPFIEVGYHSRTHADLASLNGDALMHETMPPTRMRFFAYPGGSFSHAALQAVEACGYEAGFTIRAMPVTRAQHRFALPRSVITKSMTDTDVLMQTTRAAAWYDTLRRSSLFV